MVDRYKAKLTARAKRDYALSRPEFRKAKDPVVVKGSAGMTSPVVRELAPELRAMVDAALKARKQ